MLTAVVLICASCFVSAHAGERLEQFNIDTSAISVSGISSGACMANQFHVAHSARIMGAALVAGVPYTCSGGYVSQSLLCMQSADNINIGQCIQSALDNAASGNIDSTTNMANDKVYIFHGTVDEAVDISVAGAVEQFYRAFVNTANIHVNQMAQANHAFPTWDQGNACNYFGSPFIGRCSWNGAFHMLNHIYGGGLTEPGPGDGANGRFYEFDQSEFFYVSPPSFSSMDTDGYIYVPTECESKQKACRLHIAYHGCQQGRYAIGDVFARNSGYLEVGELNDAIVVFPQAISVLLNPQGCWDWWDYIGNTYYATKSGNQILAVSRMIDRLVSG